MAVAVFVLMGGVGIGPASAKGGCKKAPKGVVAAIEGAGAFILVNARQVKAPPGETENHGAWLIASRITGQGSAVGVWLRFKLRPQATGFYVSLNDVAKMAAPDLGADLDPELLTDLSTGAYDRVVECGQLAPTYPEVPDP